MSDFISPVRTYIDLVFDRCRPSKSPSGLLADGIDLRTKIDQERIPPWNLGLADRLQLKTFMLYVATLSWGNVSCHPLLTKVLVG